MRKLAIGMALATTAFATPAVARDGSWYAGIEGGLMIVEDYNLDYNDGVRNISDGVDIGHNKGMDVDLIAGRDFGSFRAEAEIAYKRASIDEIGFQDELVNTQLSGGFFNADGRGTAASAMINGLFDFGDDDSWSGYVGGGLGYARVKYNAVVNDATFGTPGSGTPNPLQSFGFSDSDDAWAWQLIAGIRAAISPNVDLGLKYRFFNTAKLNFRDSDGVDDFTVDGKWRSHSLLASLIFNFAPPPPPPAPPPPPPPPPPPATQTCPDGSVILATDACPAPPPPPPPPPPEPERG